MSDIQVLHSGNIKTRKEAKEEGLTTYFTGSPCKHGHIDLRWTCSARCRYCQRLSSDKHLNENIDRYRESKAQYNKNRWAENKEELSKKNKEWRENNAEYNKERMRKWRCENKKYMSDYGKDYRKTPLWKCINAMGNSIKRVMNGCGDDYSIKKNGYTSEDFKCHIESKFEEGMSWDNYGEWEIDHIVPINWLFKHGITDPKTINSLNNLRPMWKSENRSKGGRYEGNGSEVFGYEIGSQYIK